MTDDEWLRIFVLGYVLKIVSETVTVSDNYLYSM